MDACLPQVGASGRFRRGGRDADGKARQIKMSVAGINITLSNFILIKLDSYGIV